MKRIALFFMLALLPNLLFGTRDQELRNRLQNQENMPLQDVVARLERLPVQRWPNGFMFLDIFAGVGNSAAHPFEPINFSGSYIQFTQLLASANIALRTVDENHSGALVHGFYTSINSLVSKDDVEEFLKISFAP